MHTQLPEFVSVIRRAFARAGLPLYAVGGAVRNALMGIAPADIDVCGPATPQDVMRVFEGGELRVLPRAVEFGTVEIIVPGGSAEYTTFRKDSYRTGHRPDSVEFVGSLAQDALRRDFSVNALYYDLHERRVVDPVGGLADLSARVLRAAPGDPEVMLREDGLRILRMVRFAGQLRFAVEPSLILAARRNLPLLDDLAVERVQRELAQIVVCDARYAELGEDVEGSLGRALALMRELGLLRKYLGTRDERAERAARCLPPVLALRLAALLGDDATPLRALRFDGATIARVTAALAARAVLGDAPPERLTRMCAIRAGKVPCEDACALLRAEGNGARAEAIESLLWQIDELRLPWVAWKLPVSGDELARRLGGAGPRVGRALQALHEYAIEHPTNLAKDALLERLEILIERKELL